MHSLQFAVPVRLSLAADRPVEEIYGVEQALDFLADWPAGRQGPVFQAAFNACFGASVGVVATEDACRALTAFCRVSGIMAKDAMLPDAAANEPDGEHARPN